MSAIRSAVDARIPQWVGDPAIFVWAVRYALSRPNQHVHEALLAAIASNADHLPANTKRVLVKDITEWLDGTGARASAVHRATWVEALAWLGGPRRTAARAAS